MPKPITRSHKGPSRGEFLIPHPSQTYLDDDTEQATAALDQAAAAAAFAFHEDGSINITASDPQGVVDVPDVPSVPSVPAVPDVVDVPDVDEKTESSSRSKSRSRSRSRDTDPKRASFAQHRELATLVDEIKIAIHTDFKAVLAKTREQLRHHSELLERQASLTEALLHQGHLGHLPDARFNHPDAGVNASGVPWSSAEMEPSIAYAVAGDEQEDQLEPKMVGTRGSAVVAPTSKAHAQAAKQADQFVRFRSVGGGNRVTASEAEALCTPEYKVEDFYYETGIFQAIAKSDAFQTVTLAVIIANAIYIGVDVDRNNADSISEAHIGFQICEYWFFSYFSFEWLARFGAFQSKLDCLKDMWFKFDTALVVMMILENTILPIIMSGVGIPIPTSMIKLVRLLRLARMARLMRALPELVAMIKGVRMAFRAVGSALLLLIMLVYIFAVIIFVVIKDSFDTIVDKNGNYFAQDSFGTLSLTMWTLLVDGAFMDSYGNLSRGLIDNSQWFVFFILLLFVLASALTVMNMLIGVLCEVVTGVAASEKEEYHVRLVKETLLIMLMSFDASENGNINRDEMASVMESETALRVLQSMQVNPKHLMEHADMLFEEDDDDDLPIAEILELILMLRGDRAPTVKDMLHGQKFQRWKITNHLRQQDKLMSTWVRGLQETIKMTKSR